MALPNTEDTKSMASQRRLLMFVRYAPSAAEVQADGLAGLGANPIAGAVSKVEGAIPNIPGLNMIIKEDKTESKSEKEYKYEYKDWDALENKMRPWLTGVFAENKVEKYEFSATGFDDRKQEGRKLLDKIKSLISSWNNYPAQIHLVGIGQGGNVINECLNLAATDAAFVSEKDNSDAAKNKWTIGSVSYIATPFYENKHALVTRPVGCSFNSVYSRLDLTQQAVEYFDPPDNLLNLIKKYETNTLSFMVGTIKMRVVKILSVILGGLNLDVNQLDNTKKQIDKFIGLKDEVEGLVNDLIGLIMELISQTEELINVKSDDLTQFKEIIDNYDKIPDQSVSILEKELSNDDPHGSPGLIQRIEDMASHGSLSLAKADIGHFLNFLNPLFNTLTDSLRTLSGDSSMIMSGKHKNDNNAKSSKEQLVDKVVESLKGAKIYKPGNSNPGNSIDVTNDDAYYPKILDRIKKENKADLVFAFINSIQNKIISATEDSDDPSKAKPEQKQALSEAIATFAHPLLISKGEVLDKLMVPLRKLTFLDDLFKDDRIKTLLGKVGTKLSELTIKFPDEFETSFNNLNNEINKINDFFRKTDYKLQDDTLYFIYNSHNLVINNVSGLMVKALCDQTGITENQNGKVWDAAKNDFIDQGQPKSNVQSTSSVPEPAN